MGSGASATSSVASGLLVFAIATAIPASSCALETEIEGEDAKPHAPLTITRTPRPTTESSL